MNSALALQKLVYEQLTADPELLTLLGGPNIFDGVPENVKPPYVVFGKIDSSDWSTGTETGEEHLIELVVWSSQRGRKQTVQIAEAVKSALKAVPDAISSNHLVNFTWENSSTNRSKDNLYFTASISFRAVTELSIA